MVFIPGEALQRDLAERGISQADDESFADVLAASIYELATSRRLAQEVDLANQVDAAILGLSERLDESNAAWDRDRDEAVAPEVDRYLKLRSGG